MSIGPNEDGAELYRMYMESQPCPTCGAKESEYISPRTDRAAAVARAEEAERQMVQLREALAEHDIVITMYPGGGIQIEQGKPPTPYIPVKIYRNNNRREGMADRITCLIHDRTYDGNGACPSCYVDLRVDLDTANACINELEQRCKTWRAKKAMLENDLGKAWEENKRLREAVEWALSYKHNCIAYPDEWFAELRRRAIGEGRGG